MAKKAAKKKPAKKATGKKKSTRKKVAKKTAKKATTKKKVAKKKAAKKNVNKTRAMKASVEDYIKKIKNDQRRSDCEALVKMMKSVTREEPKMWGSSIVGFGSYHYTYASGREGDAPLTGFSNRKDSLTVYIMAGFKSYEDKLKKLGKFKHSVSCLYIKKLEDVDKKVLKELVRDSAKYIKNKTWP